MNLDQTTAKTIQYRMAAISLVAIVASLFVALLGWGQSIEDGGIKTAQAFIIVAWTLFPPAWFWCEYVYLYPHYGLQLEEFKYLQDVASKIWLAAISALLLLSFWKDLGRH